MSCFDDELKKFQEPTVVTTQSVLPTINNPLDTILTYGFQQLRTEVVTETTNENEKE